MSGSRSGIAIPITAIDNASKQIDAINKRIAALQAQGGRLQTGFGRFAEPTRFAKLADGMRNVARESFAAFENIGRIVAPLGVITGATSIAGLAQITARFAELGTQVGFSAQRAGITVTQLGALQGAAQLAGSSAEALTVGMKSLTDNLTNAAAGRAPEATMAFGYLGVAVRDVTGHLRTANDVLPELADKIASIKNPTIQAQLATMLFGGAAEDLLPFLRRGSDGIAEYVETAKRYGVISERGAAAARELRRSQTQVTLAVRGLENAIGERLAPVMGPMLTNLADWIADNRELVSQDVASWARAGVPAVREFAGEVNAVAQAIGGWKRVGDDVLIWWGAKFFGPLSPLIRMGVIVKELKRGLEDLSKGLEGVIFGQNRALAAQRLRELPFNPTKNQIDWAKNGEPGPMPGKADSLPPSWPSLPERPPQAGMPHPGLPNPPLSGPGRMPGVVPPTEPERRATMETARQFFAGQGWTPEQTAGILANANAESRFNPAASGDGGTSFGLFQWHNDRMDRFRQFAGHDIRQSTTDEQLRFAQWELTGPERAAGDRLRATTNAPDAAAVFSEAYERPADRFGEAQRRAQAAPQYLGQPAQIVAANAPPAQIAGGAGASPPQTTTLRGSANLNIRVQTENPLGTRTTATTEGNIFAPPRIETAMAY